MPPKSNSSENRHLFRVEANLIINDSRLFMLWNRLQIVATWLGELPEPLRYARRAVA